MNNWFLLAAIPVFTLLVFVHELGHFLTAKWAGIRVEEFGIGFPPRLWSFRRGETLYSINALPIGGFVRMPGENGEVTNEQGAYDPGAFAAKPASRRLIVLLAGVTMNALLAIVLLTAAEVIGRVHYRPAIGTVTAGAPAQAAGLRPGDTIVAVNGQAITYFDDIVAVLAAESDAQPATTRTMPVTVVVRRGGEQVNVVVQALAHPSPKQGYLGISPDTTNPFVVRTPVLQAPGAAMADIGSILSSMRTVVTQLAQGKLPWDQALQGPVGIVDTTGRVASTVPVIGPYYILYLTAALSLNLALFNVLPIPGLDGGRVMFVLLEIVRRGKRVPAEREALVNLIGIGLLLALVLVVTLNDVGRLVVGR